MALLFSFCREGSHSSGAKCHKTRAADKQIKAGCAWSKVCARPGEDSFPGERISVQDVRCLLVPAGDTGWVSPFHIGLGDSRRTKTLQALPH